jgi:phage terminase large subunit
MGYLYWYAKGHNAFYDIYTEAQKNPNWYVKTLRADQSGLIPEAELLDAQQSMSSNQYEQEFLCSFEAAILGAYYGQEMRRITDLERITTIDYDPMFPCHTVWDLGYNDSTAIIWFQVVYGEIRVLDHHSSNGQPISYYTGLLDQKADEFGYKYGTHWLPHDARAKTLASGGKSIIEQISAKIDLKHLKIVPNLSIQDGIQATRLALTRTWFDNRCEELLNVCVNTKESGMMIKKYLGIARNTIGQAIQQMRCAISALFGKMKIALSSKIQRLKDFMSVKRK